MNTLNMSKKSFTRHNTVESESNRDVKNASQFLKEQRKYSREQATPLMYRKNHYSTNTILTCNFLKRELKIVRTVLLFVSMFCVAWLPYSVIAIYGQYGDDIENIINPFSSCIPFLFAKLASIYNPLVYLILNKDCRMFLKTNFCIFRDSSKDHRNAIFYI